MKPEVAIVPVQIPAESAYRSGKFIYWKKVTGFRDEPYTAALRSLSVLVIYAWDSELVAGPVPCAGGNCANGPGGSDGAVDFSALTPDQQYEGGLACNGVKGTPATPASPNGLALRACPHYGGESYE